MITFLSVVALIGLALFVAGALLWFSAARDTDTVARTGAVQRTRTAVTIGLSGLVLWAVITIILGIIALVDAWT
jgi:hypothetical protein